MAILSRWFSELPKVGYVNPLEGILPEGKDYNSGKKSGIFLCQLGDQKCHQAHLLHPFTGNSVSLAFWIHLFFGQSLRWSAILRWCWWRSNSNGAESGQDENHVSIMMDSCWFLIEQPVSWQGGLFSDSFFRFLSCSEVAWSCIWLAFDMTLHSTAIFFWRTIYVGIRKDPKVPSDVQRWVPKKKYSIHVRDSVHKVIRQRNITPIFCLQFCLRMRTP